MALLVAFMQGAAVCAGTNSDDREVPNPPFLPGAKPWEGDPRRSPEQARARAGPALLPNVISVFGSSVADGAFCGGNCSGHALGTPGVGGCYQSRLREYQETYDNRTVFNNCHGGDTTTKLLNRFYQFVASRASMVVIGLSLANQGLPECLYNSSDCQVVYDSYRDGMLELLARIKAVGAKPIIAGCYPNSGYNAQQYGLIKQMNLLTQTWDVSGVNFLGTIDDGHGRWVEGFHANGGHPNNNGSTEMYYSCARPSVL